MSITPQFMTAVNNGDITYVRVMLKNEILLSAENGSFEEMFTYARTHMNVYHQYDQSRSQSFDRSEFQFDDLPFWVKIGAGAIVVALALLMGRR